MFIKCIQCGKLFDFSDAERDFYEEKGFQQPKRCRQCRQSNRIRKNDAVVPRGRERRQQRRNAMKRVPVLTLVLLIAATFAFLNLVRPGSGSENGQRVNRTQMRSNTAVQSAYLFRSEELLEEHYEKHGRDMGFASPEEYLAGANAIVNHSNALHKTEQEDGDDVYYVQSTNDLVVVSTDGFIRTYFRPADGIAYYNRQ